MQLPHTFLAVGTLVGWIGASGSFGADAQEGRTFHASVSSAVSSRDFESIRQECYRALPASYAGAPVTVELSEPWHHGRPDDQGVLVPSWTLVRGTFFLHGVQIAGAHSLFIFNAAQDRLVACEHPVFPADGLTADPGPPAVTADEAVQVVVDQVLGVAAAGYQVRSSPLVWSLELRRYVHAVVYLPIWDAAQPVWQPAYWVPRWTLVDGQTAAMVRHGETALLAPVTGTVSGNAMPLHGGAVRRAYGPNNPEVYSSLPFIPLTLVVAGGADLGPQLSGPGGEFAFNLTADGNWGLRTTWEGNDEFKLFVVAGTQLVNASVTGVGGQTVELALNAAPTPPRSWENAVGNLTGWLYLFSGKRFSSVLQARNFRWPRGIGEFIRGFPGWWEIEYIPLPAEDDAFPILGVYQDAFPPVRKLGISEANNIFAHSSVPATWHELGHALVSAFTGQINEGGFNNHDAVVEEGIGDLWSVLMQQQADPEGEPNGVVGQGMERGFPDGFHRNIARGLTCAHDADPATPCAVEGDHDLFPGFGGIHAASLPFSGFWYDLLVALMDRYGREAGFQRTADTFVRWLDLHRGRHLPKFGRYGIYEILAVHDNEDFGGNDIPFDGTPDSDLIIRAAAARNFWLHDFVRGDANHDDQVDLSDAMATLAYLFLGGSQPDCLDAADGDDSGTLDLSDAVSTLAFLFLGGSPLPPPQQCGAIDPTPNDRLTCVTFPTCGG